MKWYGKYFRRKIESGKIKSICLVRLGHLGDVISTEPVAKFLSKYVENIYLATDVSKITNYIGTYNKVLKFKEAFSDKKEFDLAIRLIYELSPNNKTYINGYMESVGFGDKEIFDAPQLKSPISTEQKEKYVLLAPFTSEWEQEKRNWGYNNFQTLAKMIEENLKQKCILLENSYSFDEMISLIGNCDIFIGNDSGPSHIAQSFGKKSFVILGGVDPKYLNLSKNSFPIYDKKRHVLCKHTTRDEEIACCEPFCMTRIPVQEVFEVIKNNI